MNYKEIPKTELYTITPEELPELLTYIPCHSLNYNQWLAIGMAIKTAGGSYDTFDTWCRTDSARYNEKENKQKWKNFKQGNAEEEKIKLLGMAHKNGYNSPGLEEYITAKYFTPGYAIQSNKSADETAVKADMTKKYLAQGKVCNSLDSFIEFCKASKDIYSTGFSELDKYLNGGFTGGDLYTIGGLTGTCKTGLLIQIANYIAKTKPVVYVSLELSKEEIMARGIAHQTFENATINATGKTDYKQWADNNGYIQYPALNEHQIIFYCNNQNKTKARILNDAIDQYRLIADNLTIIRGDATFNVDILASCIEQYIKQNGTAPVIFIDYMQLLKPTEKTAKWTEKQQIDYNVEVLKHIAITHNIPVVMISSLNRTSYNGEKTDASLKGSGEIEYTSSTTLVVQERFFDFISKDKNIQDSYKEAIEQRKLHSEPLPVEIKIIKNRHGINGITIGYQLFSKFGYYTETGKLTHSKDNYADFMRKEYSLAVNIK